MRIFKVNCQENSLSDLYLEQLVGPLRNVGLIRSVRGAKGGYQLRVPVTKLKQAILFVY